MKVLAQGYENEKLPKMQINCSGIGFKGNNKRVPCGARLEINPFDIEKGTSKDIDGEINEYMFIRCPVCGCQTEVYGSQMTTEFKRLVI